MTANQGFLFSGVATQRALASLVSVAVSALLTSATFAICLQWFLA